MKRFQRQTSFILLCIVILGINTNALCQKNNSNKNGSTSTKIKVPLHSVIIDMDADSVILKYGVKVLYAHLLLEMNKLRAAVGARALKEFDTLDLCAQKFCDAIKAANLRGTYYAHDAFDDIELAGGLGPEDRYKNSKFRGSFSGEINGPGVSIALLLIAVQRSPGHFEILKGKQSSYCGIGNCSWTEVFGFNGELLTNRRWIVIFGKK